MPAQVKRTKRKILNPPKKEKRQQIEPIEYPESRQREFVSNQCSSKTAKGVRCKRKTLKGTKCWTHLMREDNLRVKKSYLFSENSQGNKNFGLFSAKKEIPKNKVIVPYTGIESQRPIKGDYVLEVNPYKFIDAYKSSDLAGFSNSCRTADQKAKKCKGNNAIFSKYKDKVNIKSTKKINPDEEILH